MNKRYSASGYHITTNPNFQNEKFGIVPELIKQMETLFFETQDKKNKTIIDKLTKLIIQYPKSPQLKNYLSVAYNVQGKYDKAIEVNNWILTEHPDYLFARINRANEFITNGEAEKVPEILGEAMELKSLYPERDLFHLAEVTGFYRLAVQYFVALGDVDLAENRLNILKEIAPEHPDTEAAVRYVYILLLQKGKERWEEENKNRITPQYFKKASKNITTNKPTFHYSEIENLYHFGLDIPKEKLIEIIALPRITLIEDLEKILNDAIDRYGYFESKDWDDRTNSFVLHSLFLLKEINAVESLPKILSFLEYDYEFLHYWIGEHKTETLWHCLYGLGINNTDALKQMLLKPSIDTYIKTSVSDALCQMVLHNPEKRNEVLSIYSEVFSTSLAASIDDNIIDSDFLGLAIIDIKDCNLFELLPVIKQLYDKQYVGLEIIGDYKAVEKEFAKKTRRDKKKELFSIYELYNHVLNTWDGYKKNKEKIDNYAYKPTEQAVSNKINRNDPCPCGSGKKYKKCCIDK